eukprot:COSAG05_NODE_13838_length_416_cov_2.280757_1_plen_55_part_00
MNKSVFWSIIPSDWTLVVDVLADVPGREVLVELLLELRVIREQVLHSAPHDHVL